MKRFASLLLAIVPLLTASPTRADPPRVVVSIAPLHALVSGVMQGHGRPHLLLRGGASPHRYALRPSDARALQDADLVVWVGPMLETFLARSLADADQRLLTLAETPDLRRWPVRRSDAWQSADDGHDHGHDHDHDHGAGDDHGTAPAADEDPHYWLDPRNAQAWVAAIKERLSALDPDGAERYRANAADYTAELGRLDEALAAQLAPLRQRPYLVFHDAYQYLERRYGLNALGSVAIASGRQPGLRHVLEIRRLLQDSGAVCLFSEPQFEPRLARRLVEDTTVRLAVLDPLGADTEPGAGHYPALMRGLGQALHDCLKP